MEPFIDQTGKAKINVVGVVVPAEKIIDVISQPVFSEAEMRAEEELRRARMAAMA